MPIFAFAQQSPVVFRNEGAMYIAEKLQKEDASMTINGTFVAANESAIQLDGVAILTHDFINDVISGNVFSSSSGGTFIFQGSQAQYIRGRADKTASYIYFPNLSINNYTDVLDETRDACAVFVDPGMALTVENLDIDRGRFVLQSAFNSQKGTEVAHLLIKGTVTHPTDNESRSKHEKGLFQINLQLNPTAVNGKLFGFSSPFKKIYSDYFLFNLMTIPTNNGLFGDTPRLIRTPMQPLFTGRGYLLGLGIIPESVYQQNLNPKWAGANPSDRINSHISLARDFAPRSLMQYVNTDGSITDKYTAEIITTDDTHVEIEEGWNFLGNPFTVPFDLRQIIEATSGTIEWGIDLSTHLDSYFYILYDGTGTYIPGDNIDDPVSYQFSTSYQLVNRVGSTGSFSTLIAPMQMFIIRKKTPGKAYLRLPASLRTHGDATFKRAPSRMEIVIDNEVLLEVQDESSDIVDRITIVFREDATPGWDESYDAHKLFNSTRGNSQLYTRCTTNNTLTANVIPASLSQMTLYLKPSLKEKSVTLRASRLESLPQGSCVLLTDHLTGQITNLSMVNEYIFSTTPSDREDRFSLHFTGIGTNIDTFLSQESSVWACYKDGKIIVDGMGEGYTGVAFRLYDVQGRLICSAKINHIPRIEFPFQLQPGIYLLDLMGIRLKISVADD